MRAPIGFAAVVVAVTLSGCTSIPASAADVCNIHASWVNAGRPADDLERMSTSIDAAVADDGSRVFVAARTFLAQAETGDADDIASASDELTEVCVADGWEPAEG